MAIKYKWLVEQLREIISDSIQKGINKLPTEQELAVRYRVSRQTVRAALAVLEDEREIRRIKGSGAYITGLSSLEDRNIVGILIPDEQQYEYPALINDIRVALAAEGFSCKVYPTHNHVDQERQMNRSPSSRQLKKYKFFLPAEIYLLAVFMRLASKFRVFPLVLKFRDSFVSVYCYSNLYNLRSFLREYFYQ